eukprot:GHVU01191178.1.p1 GENE.GHVU01191178.1~~GHVU01191178.1.p1  ORF type:complete len:391 (+),score=88.87 GHVU01191178.1:185-1357(+)
MQLPIVFTMIEQSPAARGVLFFLVYVSWILYRLFTAGAATFTGGWWVTEVALLAGAIFGARVLSRGGQVPYVIRSQVSLKGQTALITGGSRGIGFGAAVQLVEMGANVVLACRDERSGLAAAKALEEAADSRRLPALRRPTVEFVVMDLSDLASVRRCAAALRAKGVPLQLLVLNAAAAFPTFSMTKEGFEKMYVVTHLSHYLLVRLLEDLLVRDDARVVVTSSLAHHMARLNLKELHEPSKYSFISQYAKAKLCNVLFAKELQRRFAQHEGCKSVATSVHPGHVATDLGRPLGRGINCVNKLMRLFQKNIYEGSQTTVYSCVAPLCDIVKGGYYSDCLAKRCHKDGMSPTLARELWELNAKEVELDADSNQVGRVAVGSQQKDTAAGAN